MWLLTAFFVLSLFGFTQAVVVTHTSCSGSSITGTVVEQYLKYTGSDCTWTIVSPAGSQIVLHVRSTKIDSRCGNTTTERDRLEIHFGGSLPATICDDNFDNQIYASVYGKMTLKLATPESWSYESKSFEVMFFIAYTSDTALIPNCADRINVTGPGQLMSPNLPSRFTDNDSCSWTFWAPMGIMFYVSFTDLGSTDSLKIYDGLHRSDSLLLERNYLNKELEPVYTTGHFGRVVFAPNSENQHYGFLLTYDVGNLDPSNISVLEECNETGIYLNTPNRTFFEYLSVSKSNYKTNMDCIWYITAPENHAVEIEFEPGGYGMETNLYCDYDYLAFYEVTGLNDSLKRINRVCGYKVPKYRYQTVGNRMMIEFHSDYLVPAVGFKLRYYAIDMAYPYCREDFKSLDGTYNLETSYLNANAKWILTIRSPTIPSYWSTKYENNAEVFWLITVEDPSLYRLVLSFSYSWIESSPGCSVDWFALFRGPCRTDPLIDRTCGHYGYWLKKYNLEGTTDAYLLYFHTDNSFNFYGFRLKYYSELRSVVAEVTTTPAATQGPPVEAVIEALNGSMFYYRNDVVQTRNVSEGLEATIDFYLVGINGLDEVEQKLTSTLQLEITWRDVSLAWEPEKRNDIVMVFLPQDDIWKPDIAIMNGFEKITQMGSSFMYVNVNYNGSCLWRPYQIIETTCQVDMTHFPYDRQTCALQFGTWGSSGTVKTAFGENGLQKHHNFQDNAEWSLVSLGVDNSSTYQAGTVKFHLLIERNSRFITFYMTIPTVMLAFLNVFTFIIPVETGEKSGFSMTIFLSFVVVLIVVNDYMPDNSDNISLYAAYSLTMTFFSAIVVMLTVLQIRAASFVTKRYPISNRTHRFVRKMFAIRNKIFRIKDTPEQEFQEENDLVDTETKTVELEPEEVKDRLKVPMYPQYDYIYMAGENDVLFRKELTASSIQFERNPLVKGRETTITTDRAHSIDVQTQITTRDETRVLNGFVGKSDEENQQKLHDRVKRVRFPNESNVRHVVEAEIYTSNTEHDSDVESDGSHESLESEDLDVTNADESDENADKENDEDYQSALAVSIVKYNQNNQGRSINDDCKQDQPGNIDIKNHQSSRALSPIEKRNVQHEAILSETIAGDNISEDFYEKTNNIKVVAEAEFGSRISIHDDNKETCLKFNGMIAIADDTQPNKHEFGKTEEITVSHTNIINKDDDSDMEMVREFCNSSPTDEPSATTPVNGQNSALKKINRSVSFMEKRIRPVTPNRTISEASNRPISRNESRASARRLNSSNLGGRVAFTGTKSTGIDTKTASLSTKSILVKRPQSAVSEIWRISDVAAPKPYTKEELKSYLEDRESLSICSTPEPEDSLAGDGIEPVEWPDIVQCSDMILFVIFLVITLIVTLVFFIIMIAGS